MGSWVKMEKKLRTDPRLLDVAEAVEQRFALVDLGAVTPDRRHVTSNEAVTFTVTRPVTPVTNPPIWGVTLVLGCMAAIWMMADDHVRDGDVLSLGIDKINKLLGVPGFCEMLPGDWLEVIDAKSVKLPNYHGHNGTERGAAMTNAERQAKHRAKLKQEREQSAGLPNGDHTSGAVTSNEILPLRNVMGNALDQTRPDQSKNKKPQPLSGAANGRKPRPMRAASLAAWRVASLAIDHQQKNPTPGSSWANVDSKLDALTAAAVGEIGHMAIASRTDFNRTDLRDRFREIYEQLAERRGAT
jgi:hypothetical protein